CLFCQAGVALGLSFLVEETLVALGGAAATAGSLVLGVVAVSTIVLEALGPMAVKRSLKQAGELPEIGVYLEPHEITTIARCGVDFKDCKEIEKFCRDCPQHPDEEPSEAFTDSAKEQDTTEWFAD
ncbi:MAG: hypothetical protein ACFFD9_06120, partial [Candidatus Thorarchaeota archaeon]